MLTFLALLVAVILWCCWPIARAFAICGNGFPIGWPYEDEDDWSVNHKGGASVPKPPKQEDPKLPPMPQQQPLPPPPPPPPPPTENMSEVQQAQADQKRKAALNYGQNKTLLAGETGGYQGQPGQLQQQGDPNAKKTLLG